MELKTVHIENYRALRDVEIPLSRFGCLIGENNAGKSSVLTALSLFHSGSKLPPADYFDRTKSIRVELFISGLSDKDFARVALKHREKTKKMSDKGNMRLVRVWSPDGTNRLFQRKLLPTHPKFSMENVENLVSKQKPGKAFAEQVIAAFPELKNDMTNSTNQTAAKELIRVVAEGLPESEKSMQDAVLDTGIDESISGLIPEPIYIAAVKDLSNETKTKESTPFGKVLKILLDAIQPELQSEEALFAKLNEKLNVCAGADNRIPKIKEIESTLCKLLNETFSSVKLELRIPPPEFRTILSNAQILVNDGVDGEIESKGDGLKRAVVFSILRTWVELSRAKTVTPSASPEEDDQVLKTVLGVPEPEVHAEDEPATPYFLLFEEPELYLHPRAQGVLFDALRKFAKSHHVLITTHSPGFFGPKATETFVKLSKITDKSKAQIPFTQPHPIDLNDLSSKQQFQLICYENNSAAFFAQSVILVEGISDQIVLSHLGKLIDENWDCAKHPVAFAQLSGKSAIALYRKFFKRFAITVVVVAEADCLAVDRGYSEPLSRGQFPANREFCKFDPRNSRKIHSIALNLEGF